jgi:ATP-dependent helicase HrpA
MAAEIVQTTRLYARTVARVEVEWIEELAGHMFRRQLSDPHLDAETGTPSAWERLTMSGIVVVPRRRADLAPHDPKAARELFVREGLAAGKWATDAPFMGHNRGILERANEVEARLRRKNVVKPAEEIAAWFEGRVPTGIAEPEAFAKWFAQASPARPDLLRLSLADVVRPEAARALDPQSFPEEIELSEGAIGSVSYALAPGKDEDGITASVSLLDLPRLTDERAAWLVPGMLAEVIAGLIKTLPKPARAAVEAKGDPAKVAAECAEAMTFGNGPLGPALSEALEVLHGVKVDAAAWTIGALPTHLRLRVRVMDSIDGKEKEIGADRDLPALRKKLEPRLKKALETESKAEHDQHGMMAWTFGPLPSGEPGPDGTGFRALIDAGKSVSLTLVPTAERAEVETRLGVRRLFAIACADEVKYYLEAFAGWGEMVRQYGQLGSPEELRDQVTLIIAERVFLFEQAAVRTQTEFEERKVAHWGRLSSASREVCEATARILEARAQIARRFSGGTPRLWAQSVADIREQAAYLMPRGFIGAVGWERLRRYPVYAEVMRERLLTLREEGSQIESGALAAIAPHWKKFTGWVAGAMGEERATAENTGTTTPSGPKSGKTKAPLPQAKRAAPTVNVDAGEWAMRPGNLPTPIARYRWAVEEFRVAVLDPSRALKPAPAAAELARMASDLTAGKP